MTLRKTRTIFYGIVGAVAFHTLTDSCTAAVSSLQQCYDACTNGENRCTSGCRGSSVCATRCNSNGNKCSQACEQKFQPCQADCDKQWGNSLKDCKSHGYGYTKWKQCIDNADLARKQCMEKCPTPSAS